MRPRDQGTKWETEIVNRAQDMGLAASRIAEGGIYDRGDIEIWGDSKLGGGYWIVEAKDRANLNIHLALSKARLKAHRLESVVAWKRRIRKGQNVNRTQDGEPIVAMTLDLFLELIGGSL